MRTSDALDSPALVAIAELLGGLVLEVAALNDQLADAGNRDGLVEL